MAESTRYLIMTLQEESFAIPITSLLEIALPRAIERDAKLSQIFEKRETGPLGDSSRDLAEIEDIIAAMEGGRP